MNRDALDPIRAQILWDRLLAVVEEQAQTLVRTAFSTTVREAGDLSAGVFDRQGRMLAQAVTGTPGHVNAMAASVGYFLAAPSGRQPAAGRRAADQRPLARHRPPERFHRGDAGVPRRVLRRPVRRHLAHRRRRRPGLRPGRPAGVRGGPEHPDRLPVPGGRAEPGAAGYPAGQRARPQAALGDLHSLAACNRAGAARLLA
jgi:N-methylhydantoinase B